MINSDKYVNEIMQLVREFRESGYCKIEAEIKEKIKQQLLSEQTVIELGNDDKVALLYPESISNMEVAELNEKFNEFLNSNQRFVAVDGNPRIVVFKPKEKDNEPIPEPYHPCEWVYIEHKDKWEVGCKDKLLYKPNSDYQFCPYCAHEIQRFSEPYF